MKFLPVVIFAMLAACGDGQPQGSIYRYPQAAAPPVSWHEGMLLTGRGTIVDYHNHSLCPPGSGQRWELVSGAFLLVGVDRVIKSVVPAQYTDL